jgi:hypothetical protein
MPVTTVKVSTETRDRLRDFGGATIEVTINRALDALEDAEFWRQAEAHAAWKRSLSGERREAMQAHEDELDAVSSLFR